MKSCTLQAACVCARASLGRFSCQLSRIALFAFLATAAWGLAACGACPAVQAELDSALRGELARAGTGTFLDARSAEHLRLQVAADVLADRSRELIEEMLVGERRRRTTLDPDARGVRGLVTVDVRPVVEGVALVAVDGPEPATVARARVRLETRTQLRRAEREVALRESIMVDIDLPVAIGRREAESRVAVFLSPSRGRVSPVEVEAAAGFDEATPVRERALEALVRQWLSEAEGAELLLEVDAAGLLGAGVAITVVSYGIEEVDGHGVHLVIGLLTSLFPDDMAAPSAGALPTPDTRPRASLAMDEGTFSAALRHRLHPGGAPEAYAPDGKAVVEGRVRAFAEAVRVEPEQVQVTLRLFRSGARRCGTSLLELSFPIDRSGARPALGTPSVVELESEGRAVAQSPESWANGHLSERVRGLFADLVDGDRVRITGGRTDADVRGVARVHIESGTLHVWWPAY